MDLTKEFLEMIEDRIPGGRFLTTVALLLGLLAIIAASCASLLEHVVLPVYTVTAAVVTKGVITRSEFFRFLFSVAVSAGVFWLLEWAVKGSRRLMRDVLDNSKTVLDGQSKILAVAQDANERMLEVVGMVRQLEARVEALENR